MENGIGFGDEEGELKFCSQFFCLFGWIQFYFFNFIEIFDSFFIFILYQLDLGYVVIIEVSIIRDCYYVIELC